MAALVQERLTTTDVPRRSHSAFKAKQKSSRGDLKSAHWSMHEFFAGSGLVAYGLKGLFRSVWSNDICPKKAEVYSSNFNDTHFVLDDIKNISGTTLPHAHLSWASFPCQDLSLAGLLGGIHAKRSGLVWEWMRILTEMKTTPSILLVENVTGLLSVKNGENYRMLHEALVKLGYRCGAVVLDAAYFVPQSRPRVFVIAVKDGVTIPEGLQSDEPCWLHNKAAITLGRTLENWIWWYADKPQRSNKRLIDFIDLSIPCNKDEILKLIPQHHLDRLSTVDDAVFAAYRRTRNGTQCLELRFDGIAGCLRTPEGGSSKQFIVIKQDKELHARLLTSREAARLMGVSDYFVLPKNANDGYKAMGDAVVVPVAAFLGKEFLTKLAEAAYE